MKNIPFLSILSICLLLTQSCNFEKSKNTLDQKEAEINEKQKRYEAISKQLNTNKDCIIYDSCFVFKSVEEFLQMERFKGKVVYLDFWGTGCKPCIEEFAHLPELKKKFEGQPVEFVYITTFRGKELSTYQEKIWKILIEKHKLTGINLLISSDAKHRFYSRYRNIVDPRWADIIPVYLLFNKQGNVVNFVAPRPSSKEVLYAEIQDLLNKQ